MSNSGISLSCCSKFYSGMFVFSLWDFILLVCVLCACWCGHTCMFVYVFVTVRVGECVGH